MLDEFGQEIRSFISDIGRAHGQGLTEMEVSPEVIAYYNPNGLGPSRYFIFQGVKVYPTGEREKIQAEEAIGIEQRNHKGGGVVVGRTA